MINYVCLHSFLVKVHALRAIRTTKTKKERKTSSKNQITFIGYSFTELFPRTVNSKFDSIVQSAFERCTLEVT